MRGAWCACSQHTAHSSCPGLRCSIATATYCCRRRHHDYLYLPPATVTHCAQSRAALARQLSLLDCLLCCQPSPSPASSRFRHDVPWLMIWRRAHPRTCSLRLLPTICKSYLVLMQYKSGLPLPTATCDWPPPPQGRSSRRRKEKKRKEERRKEKREPLRLRSSNTRGLISRRACVAAVVRPRPPKRPTLLRLRPSIPVLPLPLRLLLLLQPSRWTTADG